MNWMSTKKLYSSAKMLNSLMCAIFLFWLLTISSIKINYSYANPLSHIISLPIFYWIGLFLIIISTIILFINPPMRICYVRNYLFIIFIGLYLFGISPFAYPNPIHIDIYGYLGSVNQLIDQYYSCRYTYQTLCLSEPWINPTFWAVSRISWYSLIGQVPVFLCNL